jgi:hypothetical protein
MPSVVVKVCFSIVARSRWGRSSNTLSEKSRLRATVSPVSDAGGPPRSGLGFKADDGDRATKGVGDVGSDRIGLEEPGSVSLATVGDLFFHSSCKRRSRPRTIAGALALVTLALLQKWVNVSERDDSVHGRDPHQATK